MLPFHVRVPGTTGGPATAQQMAQVQRVLRAPAPFDNLLDRAKLVAAFNRAAADRGQNPWDDPFTAEGPGGSPRWTPRAPSEVDYLMEEARRRGVHVFRLPGLAYLQPPATLRGRNNQTNDVRLQATQTPREWLELLVKNQSMAPQGGNYGENIEATGIPAFIGEGYDWFSGYPKSEEVRRYIWGREPWNTTYAGVALWQSPPVARHKWIERYLTEANAAAAAAKTAALAKLQQASAAEAAARAQKAADEARARTQQALQAERYLVKPSDITADESLAEYLGREAGRLNRKPWQLPGLRYLQPPDTLAWFRDAVEKHGNPTAFFKVLEDVARKGSQYAPATSEVLKAYLTDLGYGRLAYASPWHEGGTAVSADPLAIHAHDVRRDLVDWMAHMGNYAGACAPNPDDRERKPPRAGCTPFLLGLALTNYYTQAMGSDAAERLIADNERVRGLIQQARRSGDSQKAQQLTAQLKSQQQIAKQSQQAQKAALPPAISRAKAQVRQIAKQSIQNTRRTSQRVIKEVENTPIMKAKAAFEGAVSNIANFFGPWLPWAGAAAGVIIGSFIPFGNFMMKLGLMAGLGLLGYLFVNGWLHSGGSA